MIDIGQVLPLFIFQPLHREKVAVFDYQGLSPREDKGGAETAVSTVSDDSMRRAGVGCVCLFLHSLTVISFELSVAMNSGAYMHWMVLRPLEKWPAWLTQRSLSTK